MATTSRAYRLSSQDRAPLLTTHRSSTRRSPRSPGTKRRACQRIPRRDHHASRVTRVRRRAFALLAGRRRSAYVLRSSLGSVADHPLIDGHLGSHLAVQLHPGRSVDHLSQVLGFRPELLLQIDHVPWRGCIPMCRVRAVGFRAERCPPFRQRSASRDLRCRWGSSNLPSAHALAACRLRGCSVHVGRLLSSRLAPGSRRRVVQGLSVVSADSTDLVHP